MNFMTRSAIPNKASLPIIRHEPTNKDIIVTMGVLHNTRSDYTWDR